MTRSGRGFIVLVVTLALLLLVAKSPLGGMVGVFAGSAVAFFVAGPAMLQGVSQDNFTTVAIVVSIIWAGLIVLACVLTVRYAFAGDSDAARGRAGTALAWCCPGGAVDERGDAAGMWP